MNHTPYAIACVHGENGIHGTVQFIPHCAGVLVIADVCGLPDSETNFFAFHIHEGGDCAGKGFPNTGSHFNPLNVEHPKHAGDFPPLLGCNGKAHLAVVTNRFRIRDVIGRTVVIHAHPDDFKTQPAGDAGMKIACGVIKRV